MTNNACSWSSQWQPAAPTLNTSLQQQEHKCFIGQEKHLSCSCRNEAPTWIFIFIIWAGLQCSLSLSLNCHSRLDIIYFQHCKYVEYFFNIVTDFIRLSLCYSGTFMTILISSGQVPMLDAHAACSFCMPMLYAHAHACPGCMSMLHVLSSSIDIKHGYAAWIWRMYV